MPIKTPDQDSFFAYVPREVIYQEHSQVFGTSPWESTLPVFNLLKVLGLLGLF